LLDEGIFRSSGHLAFCRHINTDKFQAGVEEHAFLEFQRDAEVEANAENDIEVQEQVGNGIRPEQGIVDDLAGTIKCGLEAGMIAGTAGPHAAETKHKGNVNSRGINRAEGHHSPGIFHVTGAEKG